LAQRRKYIESVRQEQLGAKVKRNVPGGDIPKRSPQKSKGEFVARSQLKVDVLQQQLQEMRNHVSTLRSQNNSHRPIQEKVEETIEAIEENHELKAEKQEMQSGTNSLSRIHEVFSEFKIDRSCLTVIFFFKNLLRFL